MEPHDENNQPAAPLVVTEIVAAPEHVEPPPALVLPQQDPFSSRNPPPTISPLPSKPHGAGTVFSFPEPATLLVYANAQLVSSIVSPPTHVYAFYRGEQNAVKNVYLTRSIQVDSKMYRQNDTCTINGQEYLIVAIKLHYYHNNATGRKVSIVLANLTTSEFGQVMALSTLHRFTWAAATEEKVSVAKTVFGAHPPTMRLKSIDLLALQPSPDAAIAETHQTSHHDLRPKAETKPTPTPEHKAETPRKRTSAVSPHEQGRVRKKQHSDPAPLQDSESNGNPIILSEAQLQNIISQAIAQALTNVVPVPAVSSQENHVTPASYYFYFGSDARTASMSGRTA
jgi:hypothetical protein